MKNVRKVDELVSRITAILAFYRQDDGRWDARPPLTGELRNAIEELKSLDTAGPQIRLRFYRTLEAELIARYEEPVGRRLVSLVRGVAQPLLRNEATVSP